MGMRMLLSSEVAAGWTTEVSPENRPSQVTKASLTKRSDGVSIVAWMNTKHTRVRVGYDDNGRCLVLTPLHGLEACSMMSEQQDVR